MFIKAAKPATTPAPAATTRRKKDAERKRKEAEKGRTVHIPPCANRRRRNRLEKIDEKWLRWYFGRCEGCLDPFWYAFTVQQKEMIEAIRDAILYGGDQAIAASRGEGKTTIFERMLLKYTLQGTISFSVLFAATGTAADNSLESIKMALEENERLLADYPEVCVPVRELENVPNRAHYQLVQGVRHSDSRKKFENHSSRFTWCGQQIVFPNIPGSPSSGAIIATRGLDAAVRGLKKRGKRPDVAVIDDPDTEETARSEEQAKKLEDRIDKAIAGLGGQQRSIARVMLTTIQNRTCVSYRFTDPSQKPTWKGRRFRFLLKPPKRVDMWDEYVQQRQIDMQSGDEFARKSHQFYLDNRKEMEAGAKVANLNRFDPQKLPDGSQLEVSALQRYYNEVARIGPEAVASEYDNDPPEESGPIESSITPHLIQTKVSGYPQRIVPPGCTIVTQGIDVGKIAMHWVVRAWRPDCKGFVIDYGVQETHGTVYGSDEGLDVAIRRALITRWEHVAVEPYVNANGDAVPVDMTVIDSRYRKSAVVRACQQIGKGVYPAMGCGKSHGCVRMNFTEIRRRTSDKKPGDGWFLSRQDRTTWVCMFDADHWKAWEHDRWMTDRTMPGSLVMFGTPSERGHRMSEDEKAHHAYAHHICNEKEVEEVVKGALKRYWRCKGVNHWLDASAMSDVAANMMGIKLLTPDGRTVQPVVANQKEIDAKGGWFASQGKPKRRHGGA